MNEICYSVREEGVKVVAPQIMNVNKAGTVIKALVEGSIECCIHYPGSVLERKYGSYHDAGAQKGGTRGF